MKLTIAFADLVHTDHSCNAMPYGVALVTVYARKVLGDVFEPKIFKFTADLLAYLDTEIPPVVCFSNYIWNGDLAYNIARRIKARKPSTIIIFGGPNYPITPAEQHAFLESHPAIDFYIYKDGEEAFAALLAALLETGLDAAGLKATGKSLPNCHYFAGRELILGPLRPVIAELNDIPSPYLEGLLDSFFPRKLLPLVQTTRGCPFHCTFCQDGDDYANKVKRYTPTRIEQELEYIAQRAQVPQLLWADLNFGMYRQDLETCRTIVKLKSKYGWPRALDLNGKNRKEQVLEAARIIDGPNLDGGTVMLVAAVQSTDIDVLTKIRRQNVSTEAMVGVAREGTAIGSNSFSEVILCLPGDSKRAHRKTIHDLMACGINVVRSHQFIMLPGSEAATRESREKFGMVTRYRVTPRTMGRYRVFEEEFISPEIDEICIANNTLSERDYLDCRQYNLTVEIFYNYGVFRELIAFLRAKDVSIPDFIDTIHDTILNEPTPLTDIYASFLRETQELFHSREELEAFLAQPGVPDRYRNGELGNNEQLLYRALAVFRHMGACHDIAFDVAHHMLIRKECYTDKMGDYLDQLKLFSIHRKSKMLLPEEGGLETFDYDFVALNDVDFAGDPEDFRQRTPLNIKFFHTDSQRSLIRQYIDIYGVDDYGLSVILGSQTNVNNFYRATAKHDPNSGEIPR